MKKTKVAFFGTSDRSLPILESLNKHFELVLCVTKHDTKVGRKQEMKETAVKKWARDHVIRYVEIRSLKEYDLDLVLNELGKAKPAYGIVADFSYIIPESIINFFGGRLINIHFSLLPKYRGASPVQFAILNGDETTGITFLLVSKRLDAGDILSQIGYKMNGTETSGELYETLFSVAAEKLPEVIEGYKSGSIRPMPQDENNATYTYSKTHPHHTFIFKEDGLINWKNDVKSIERKIRAFNPWPIAWTYLKDLQEASNLAHGKLNFRDSVDLELTVKIYSAHLEKDKLHIDKLQVEGRKIMTWEEFKNGYLEQT
ncbi:MAG: methionyl-tRNA formyltransferase [Patescibacteria group bacterium]|nr:MAG: methionyl-tRNA formyltransferase [Patescibacteria group bacterium]